MFDIELTRTQTERTGDSARPFQFNRTQGHEERVEAYCKRVQREYFDSGLCYDEMHQAQGGDMANLVGWELIDD